MNVDGDGTSSAGPGLRINLIAPLDMMAAFGNQGSTPGVTKNDNIGHGGSLAGGNANFFGQYPSHQTPNEDKKTQVRGKWEEFKRRAANQFFDKSEILWILQHAKFLEFSTKPDKSPEPGGLYIFDRKVTRYWRRDSHDWKQKNDSHERLKMNKIPTLGCSYNVHRVQPEFHRRGYWLLDHPDVIFVHYAMVSHTQKRHNSRSARSRSRSPKRKFQETISPVSPLHLSPNGAFQTTTSFSMPQPSPPELQIIDHAPWWDYLSGGAKVLLVVTSASGSNERHILGPNVFAMFGTKTVPAERVINGVYRFRAPAVTMDDTIGGKVDVMLTDGKIRSNTVKFTYLGVPDFHSAGNKMMNAAGDQKGESARDGTVELTRALGSITLGDVGINKADMADIEGDVSDDIFSTAAERIQKQFRAWLYKRHNAAKKLQSFIRGAMVRKSIQRDHNAAKVIQNQFRAQKQRREFQKLRNATVTIQNTYRALKRNKRSQSGLSTPASPRTTSAPPRPRLSGDTQRDSLNSVAAKAFAESCIAPQDSWLMKEDSKQGMDPSSSTDLTKSTSRMSLEGKSEDVNSILSKDLEGNLPKFSTTSKFMEEDWSQLGLSSLDREFNEEKDKNSSSNEPAPPIIVKKESEKTASDNDMQSSFPQLEEIGLYFS